MKKAFTEQQLLLLIAEDDRESFSIIIYRNYWHELYCEAYKRLRNEEQAEDCDPVIEGEAVSQKCRLNINEIASVIPFSRLPVVVSVKAGDDVMTFLDSPGARG